MTDEVGTAEPEERGVGDELAALYDRWREVRGRESTVAALTALGVLVFPWLFVRLPPLVGVPSDMSGYYGLASLILIWGIFAVGFDLLLGYTGLLSFGHAAFWGGAAYAAGVFSAQVSGSPLLMVLAGTAVAVLLAWLIGFLSLRRGGIYFAILTLAFGQMMFYMSSSPLAFITNGENGFTNVQTGDLFGVVDLGGHPPSVLGPLFGDWLYVFVGVFTVLAVVVGYRILNSPYGLVLRAIRENERRTEFVGLNVWRYKLMAFIISGAFAGVAGSLFAIHKAYVPLESLHWSQSGEIVVMTVLGGVGSLFGPIFGAGIYLYVANIVQGMSDVVVPFTDVVLVQDVGAFWHLILGAVFVAVIVLFPEGVWGGIESARDAVADRLGGEQ
jgi:branched-chain amino acid transport system permease protein